MPTANEALRDAITSHSVDLEQYKLGVVRRIIALLNRVDTGLSAQLTTALQAAGDATTFTVERLDSLLWSVRALNQAAYARVSQELGVELRKFADVESEAQVAMLRDAAPTVRVASIPPGQAYAAAMSRPFQGRLLSEWAQGIEADRMVRIRDAVRMGMLEQQTIDQIVRRVRGTRAKGYEDGIIQIDRRAAEAVVRTAVSHVAATARDAVMGANADLFSAVQWLATLDTRTSPGCRIRDGRLYTPETHKPVDHSLPWLSGPGRLHWRCRSTSMPIVKSWRELGIPIDDLPPGTRASMDGQVPADQSYRQWFAKQSAARQDEIVGPQRGRMIRAGKIAFDDLYTNRGEWLSIDDLIARNRRLRLAA